jgi:hypothetical protein
MTKLSERKTRLQFTTDAEVRYRGKLRPVVVEVTNGFVGNVRLGGTRLRYPFSWASVFHDAGERFARSERERKRKEREERRKQR